jgi:hypothetical protein
VTTVRDIVSSHKGGYMTAVGTVMFVWVKTSIKKVGPKNNKNGSLGSY